jgi:hypothetical protein
MEIRRSTPDDLPQIRTIYKNAREFMKSNGNPTQWGDIWPPDDVLSGDVAPDGSGYVVVDNNHQQNSTADSRYNGNIVGVFALYKNTNEPAYAKIDGEWVNKDPYAVVHRCATDGKTKGVGTFIMEWAFAQFPNIRVDTHANNKPMLGLLKKLKYRYCGIINYLNDETDDPASGLDDLSRVAYQKC